MDRRLRDDDSDDDRDSARGEPAAAGGEGADRPDAAGGHPTAGDGQSEQSGEAARMRVLAGQLPGAEIFPQSGGVI